MKEILNKKDRFESLSVYFDKDGKMRIETDTGGTVASYAVFDLPPEETEEIYLALKKVLESRKKLSKKTTPKLYTIY